MGENEISPKYGVCLVSSIILNIFFIINLYLGSRSDDWNPSWSKKAAAEGEAVGDILCSGHGRAYLDGLVLGDEKNPACECNSCYGGSDCSQIIPGCSADADGGDPLFLEPFWRQHAAESAVLVAGWHRMSYMYNDHTYMSATLETLIRKLHATVGNAITDGKFIVFGAGSTQILNAAVHSLSLENSSTPSRVLASIPFYKLYESQTEYFQSQDFEFEGDTSLWKNTSDTNMSIIEFVTSPNNPDGQLKKAVLHGPYVKVIHDRAYYWPHFTAISAPANEDLSVFTLSKLTGHAGTRFGWALIKDERLYQRMTAYMSLNTMGVSRDSQLRTLKLLKVVLDGGGREILEFGYKKMRDRWERLSKTIYMGTRFSLQKIAPQYCTFFQQVREASPAYAWLRCERVEDTNCYAVLRAANISGREGSVFGFEDRYVRLSLIRSQDDFDLLLQRLNILVSEEDGAKTM